MRKFSSVLFMFAVVAVPQQTSPLRTGLQGPLVRFQLFFTCIGILYVHFNINRTKQCYNSTVDMINSFSSDKCKM